MERIELLGRLGEPFETLSEEERALAHTLSQSDPEVRQAVKVSRALSASRASEFYAAPASSDVAFLAAVRNRLSIRKAVDYARIFPRPRSVVMVASACVVILLAVIVGGRYSSSISVEGAAPMTSYGTSEPQTILKDRALPKATGVSVSEDEDGDPIPVDSLADAGVDPLELAEYLNVSDLAEQTVTVDEDTLPLTDQLLALDVGTLEEVLDDLEATSFF